MSWALWSMHVILEAKDLQILISVSFHIYHHIHHPFSFFLHVFPFYLSHSSISSPFISLCLLLSTAKISFFLACSLFWIFLLQWVFWMKRQMLEWNLPHFCSVCMCVCVGVCVCVWAHAWPSRAVKVRLIHWLQLRGVERSAEFNSYLFGLLPLTNADRFAKCLRQTACVWKRNGELGHVFSSLSLFYQANFVHVSNPSRRADCLACFQIIAPFITEGQGGWLNMFAGS